MKRLRYAILALLLLGTMAQAAIVTKYLLGTQTTLLTINSLGNGLVTGPGASYDNSPGGAGGGYPLCDIEAVVTFGNSPNANSGITLWLEMAPDGINFEDTTNTTVILGRAPNASLPATTGQASTRVTRRIDCPWGLFRAFAKNDSTGQTTTPSGNSIKIRPVTWQGVSQ